MEKAKTIDLPLSDRYIKIANAISAGLDRLAQVMPGETLRFRAVTFDEAHDAL